MGVPRLLPTMRRSTPATKASSSSVWWAWAVSRSREIRSEVDDGRKQPIRTPCAAAAATAASASPGPGIGAVVGARMSLWPAGRRMTGSDLAWTDG